MTFEVWPFLVAASKKIDYSTVLYPNFLDDKSNYIIAKSAIKKENDENYYLRNIKINKIDYYLFYKSFLGISSFINHLSEDINPLKDDFGRPLYLSGGVVFKDKSLIKYLDSNKMDDIYSEHIVPYYNQFYKETSFLHAFKSDKLTLNLQPSLIKYTVELTIEFTINLKDNVYKAPLRQESGTNLFSDNKKKIEPLM